MGHNDKLILKFKLFQVVMVFFDTQVNLVTAMYDLSFASFHVTSNVTHLKTWKMSVTWVKHVTFNGALNFESTVNKYKAYLFRKLQKKIQPKP